MPVVRVHNSGAVGLIKDQPDHELPPEAWSDAENIRFEDGYACKFLGHTAIYDPPTIAPYWLLHQRESAINYWLYAGLAAVYVTDGTTHKNISKVGGYSATEATGWSGGVLGGIPILNNPNDDPQMWNPVDFATPGLLADLSNWPASTTCKIMRVFGNFLIALAPTKSGTEYPHVVKWSQPADPLTVPDSWNEADATKLAGEESLSETGGVIVDCMPLRQDMNVIYKQDAIVGMQLISGVLVFRFPVLFQTIGALSRRCMQAFRSRHVVFGFEDIIIHDGQRAESIAKRRIQKHIRNNLDGDNYGLSFISFNPTKQEFWFCYPTTGAARPNQAAIWNFQDGTWSIRDLPLVADLKWGIVDTSEDDTWGSGPAVTWEEDTRTWSSGLFNPSELGFLGAVPGATKLYRFDDTNQEAGSNMTVRLERTGLAVVGRARDGSPRVDFDSRKLVRSIRPRIQGGPVNVTVGMQDVRNGAVRWGPTQSFDPATDEKLDTAINGRLVAVKFESAGNVDWKLYGYDLDLEVVSRF